MICPTCNDPMRVVPAGVSRKTGKPYRSFEACDKPACKDAKRSNYNSTSSVQTTFAPDKITALEETIAKIRIAYADLDKRLKAVETWQEGANPEARKLHAAFEPGEIEKIVLDAAPLDK